MRNIFFSFNKQEYQTGDVNLTQTIDAIWAAYVSLESPFRSRLSLRTKLGFGI